MKPPPAILETIRNAVRKERLLDTAVRLVSVPSKTGTAGVVSDCLAALLAADGFDVDRIAAGHDPAPAVVARFTSGRPGKTLQFNGHLDTVHLPYVQPKVEGDLLTGSGASDMKGGMAAAVEAVRALRDTGLLPGGSILLTAHDLHESPWGDGSQLNRLIQDGVHGDAVLLPEYLDSCLPIIGRGGLTWKATLRRPGAPIHEVLRPRDEPSVIAAGAQLVARLNQLDRALAPRSDPLAGSESLFIGQMHSGEIFNQYPQECLVEGTRRWLPGTQRQDVENELRAIFAEVAAATGVTITATFNLMRDAYLLDQQDTLVTAFHEACEATAGARLPVGAKPFCDDGNSFWALANIPAITHGPKAGGAHTLNEWVSVADLVRVAQVYALTAVQYCSEA